MGLDGNSNVFNFPDVTLDDLTDIVSRVNESLDGMSTAEKENEIKDLIRRTSSRVLPGIPWLPHDYYGDDEPGRASRNRRPRRRDQDGRPILDSDDEVVAIKDGRDPSNNPKNVALPKKTAKIPEPHTDSETSSNSSKGSGFPKPGTSGKRTTKVRTSSNCKTCLTLVHNACSYQLKVPTPTTESPSKKRKRSQEQEQELDPGDNFDDMPPLEDPEEHSVPANVQEQSQEQPTSEQPPSQTRSIDPSDWFPALSRSGASAATSTMTQAETLTDIQQRVIHVEENQSVRAFVQYFWVCLGLFAIMSILKNDCNLSSFFQNLNDRMSDLVEQMVAVRDLVQGLKDFREGRSTIEELSQASARLDRARGRDTASTISDEPERSYNSTENKLLKLLPINRYTRAIDWLLQQKVVRDFIRYETMSRIYKGFITFKPEMDDVLTTYFDMVVSVRLQAHMGKAVSGRSPLFHFGRFPLPQPLLKIAMEDLNKLSRIRAPGMRDEADFFKSKCITAKRTHINSNKYLVDAESKEEVALRLWWERLDFYRKHKVSAAQSVPNRTKAWSLTSSFLFQHHFPNEDPEHPSWPFEKELRFSQALAVTKSKPSDPNFDYKAHTAPENIEDMFFRGMSKGRELHSMTEAKALVEELNKSGISQPRFAEGTWEVRSSKHQFVLNRPKLFFPFS